MNNSMNVEKRTLQDVMEGFFARYADQPAFTCQGKTLTYAEVDKLSCNFAGYLQQINDLQVGDRVALIMPNILQYPVALYGVIRAGLVVVNTNPMYTKREIKHQLKDSGAKAVIASADLLDSVTASIADTDVIQLVVTQIDDFTSEESVAGLEQSVTVETCPLEYFLPSLIIGEGPYRKVSSHTDDMALLQYTGGTTGVAKGAIITHDNLISSMMQDVAHVGEDCFDKGDVVVAPLPLYHIYGFNTHCVEVMEMGGHNILIPDPRDIDAFVTALKPFKMNRFVGINTLFASLSREDSFRALDFSALRRTDSGGMALSEVVARQWLDVTGGMPADGYGLTETSPFATGNPLDAIQLGTIGTPIPHTELKVIDANCNALEPDLPGELCIRGPQVMKGYWQRPEATAEVLDEDGWLRTGDIAIIQQDGYVRLVDRQKDMMLVSGFNVYPFEIEEVVSAYPGVLESAVIGIPDEKSGEAVKLFVVSKSDGMEEAELRAYLRDNLTGYKLPKHIVIRDEPLPKSPVGKILRKELRA